MRLILQVEREGRAVLLRKGTESMLSVVKSTEHVVGPNSDVLLRSLDMVL